MKHAYQVITDQIIQLLKQGTVPWHRPWLPEQEAQNLITKKPYKGINRFLLNTAPYQCRYWLTMRQANQMGGKIKKGERSTPVVFWKIIEKRDEKTNEIKTIPVLRYYRVFNLEQCQGIEMPKDRKEIKNKFTPIKRCQIVIKKMPHPPAIQHQKQTAYYNPKQDMINMPKPETFCSSEEYYSTLFHELAHSTGHPKRLNRNTLNTMAPFGSTNYSKEELIAEMTCAFLCGHTGIINQTIQNSAAYINGWLQRFKKNNRLVVTAAANAQKAADYILAHKH